jgi:hypothetical protein
VSEPRHEALVGAALLGIAKAEGWVAMPLVVDVNRVCEAISAAGGVGMEREHAVSFARGLVDRACEAEGWPKPGKDYDVDEVALATLLGAAYDKLIGGVQP